MVPEEDALGQDARYFVKHNAAARGFLSLRGIAQAKLTAMYITLTFACLLLWDTLN